MAIVHIFRKLDLFITVICNPNCFKIKDAFFSKQTVQDRPDLINHIFNIKLKTILKNILKEKIFETVVAYFYTIEFQKYRLPHVHILSILAQEYKSKNVTEYNTIVSAEIPDRIRNPNIFYTVQ